MAQHPFQNFMSRYRAGEPIFVEGEAAQTMFIVQQGKISLYRDVNDHKQQIGVMEKGDFFGEMSILEGLPRTLSAEALEDCELIEINSMIFDKMIRANIEIAIRMLRKLSIRLRENEVKLSDLQANGARPTRTATSTKAAKDKLARSAETGARLEADGQGLSYPLGDSETIIGRYDPVTEQKPDVDLTDLDLKRSVSRRHARIVRTGESFVIIEEVGALNGTFVNDTQLTPGQQHPIDSGDRVNVGNVAMIFRT